MSSDSRRVDKTRIVGLTEEEILELPVEELALHVLADAAHERAWNVRNWMLTLREFGLRADGVVADALSEAWQWLFTYGLVARDYTQSSSEAFRITRQGKEALANRANALAQVRAQAKINLDLHPSLEHVRLLFRMGDYETAAFKAMRQVEIAVRDRIGAEPTALGVDLMRRAFAVGGPLGSDDLVAAEKDARSHLYAGAIGLFKNPPSHRVVDYHDATEAAEVVLLADLLLRLLERIPE